MIDTIQSRSITHNDLSLFLTQIRDSDCDFFWKTCESHRKKLFRMAFRITKNTCDAEDAVQETLLRAYRKRGQFEGRCAFGTWLTTILIHTCLMELRRRRVRNAFLTEQLWEDGEPWRDTLEDKQESTEAALIRLEKAQIMNDAVSRLKPRSRDLIVDRLRDMSLKESARNRGITIAAAKSRIHRAHSALKRDLLRTLIVRPRTEANATRP